MNDLWYALRALRKSPGFALAAILTLAMAIAADCVVFSVADAVLFRPLPYKEPDRLYHVWCGWRGHPATFGASRADFLDWKRRNSVFEDMALTVSGSLDVRLGGSPEMIDAEWASVNLFPMLGIQPALGRTFSAEEGYTGRAEQVAMLSYGFWQSRFQGDPNIIGRVLDQLPPSPLSPLGSGAKTTVVGVLPAAFKFTYPKGPSIWIPLALDRPGAREASSNLVIARLKPGVTPEQARAGMRTVLADLAREYPQTNRDMVEVQVMSVRGWTTRQVRSILITLLGAVTFVLLIGCANVANIALARLADRERETTVRAALGAGRWRLVREFLAESLLIALVAGGLGLLLSSWGMDLLRSLLPPGLPRGDEVRLDGRVAWFAMALSLATTVAFGLLPALKCSKINLVEGLAGSSASLGGRRGKGARVWLVVAETALALVLAAGAGLMMNSFVRLMRLDLGMDPKNLLAVSVWPGQRVHPLQRGAYHAFEPALEATRSVPGVKQAGAVEVAAPLMGGGSATEIRPKPTSPGMLIDCKVVDGAYFGTLGISLRAGRVFTSQDTDRSASVVVVNESLARMLYPAGGAVGRPLGYSTKPSTIVGVVADVRNRVLFPPGPEVYRPATQMGGLRMPTLVVRYEEAGKANVNALIRQRLSELDPTSIIQIRSFEEAIAQQGLQTRFLTALIAGLGALGLLLAASGVFGVTAYGVNRRTRELGVRLAIGAAPDDVLRMIVREAVVMALAGAAIGTAAVFALSSVLRNLLFEVPPGDPLTLLAVIGVLAAVTIAASYVPARRVLQIDPAAALRHE